MIRLFFENRRRSGGGDIDRLVAFPDKIVVTFKTNDGTIDVTMSKRCKTTHSVALEFAFFSCDESV